jgi:transposase-like protein
MTPTMAAYICHYCGSEFEAPTWRPRKVCSKACQHKLMSLNYMGSQHPNWKGGKVSPQGGRVRARRIHPLPRTCERCDKPAVERHHKDGDPTNNYRENLAFLCRRCHMEVDGRLEATVAQLEKARDALRLSDAEIAETVRLYRSGLSLAAIGRQLGVTGEAIGQRLRRIGEPRRSWRAA